MASFMTANAADLINEQALDWLNDTIKARLVASSASPSRADTAMTGFTSIDSDETLADKTIVKDVTDQYRSLLCQNATVTWAAVAAGSTVGWICVFKFVTNDADSIPIVWIDISPDMPTNGSDLTWSPQLVSTGGVTGVVAYMDCGS